MLQHKDINFNIGKLIPLGILISASIGIASFSPAEAISPTVTATFMSPVGETSLQPGSNSNSIVSFYVPVKITTKDTESLSISVKAASSSLTGTNNKTNEITSVPNGVEYTVGQMQNQWGYRWNFGDSIYDAPNNGTNPKNYKQMPTTSTVLSTANVRNTIGTTITKYLTLGFGVGVNGGTPSDNYTNQVTVSVVATPRELTIFDISYMQDMTTDICKSTTTPTVTGISAGADINVTSTGGSYTTAIDTDGTHRGDTTLVPQKELTDKRDGKKYTIRKLADGNCWMISNLEFDIVPTSSKDTSAGTTPSTAFSTNGTDKVTGTQITLTNADTDLNSISTWTPQVASQLYGAAGTVYKTQRNAGQGAYTEIAASATTATTWDQSGTDGIRSFSSAAGYPSRLYSAKTAATPSFSTSNTGNPWQKFGNLYNWTAATLGSGAKTTSDNQNAQDSICPKGWRLPPNTGNGSFLNLLNAYNIGANNATNANKLTNFPLNFLRTGNYAYDSGKVFGRTYGGSFWSGARSSSANAYLMNTDTTIVPQDSINRGYGLAIRCVAR